MAKKKSAKKTSAKKSPAKKKPAKKKPMKKAPAKMGPGRSKKAASKKVAKKKRPKARKRELIDTGTDNRYVRRNDEGQFQDVVDVSRSLSADIRQHAMTEAGPGQGDRGD